MEHRVPGAAVRAEPQARGRAAGGRRKKPYAFTAITALPPGLKLARNTGVVSGTPAKAGSYTVMVTIADSAGPARNTVTVPIKITIT